MSAPEEAFDIAPRVTWPMRLRPYVRRPDDPATRRLHIYALDPAASRLEGSIASVEVPFETLLPGPVGALIEVRDEAWIDDPKSGRRRRVRYTPIDLDDVAFLRKGGDPPTPSDWKSHQQMVYAVSARLHDVFRAALGREPCWGFAPPSDANRPWRLVIRPHAQFKDDVRNAQYVQATGSLEFGYFRSTNASGRNHPEGWVFLCLSHDVVAHEMTHALLDGVRPRYNLASSADSLGFHEGFADAVALLMRLTHRDVVRPAMRVLRGDLTSPSVLTSFAQQFGETIGLGRALRNALLTRRRNGQPMVYRPSMEAHDMGNVLLSAIFEAFETIFRRRTARLVRLATGGSGILPPGDPPHDLLEVLTHELRRLAEQFLRICIRAIDYCPPVGLTLGEYLRALVTADQQVFPDDPLAYREAFIDAFRRRRIFPDDVTSLDEDSLLWRPPRFYRKEPLVIPELRFDRLRFGSGPDVMAGESELRRQAIALGRFATDPDHRRAFSLHAPGPAPASDELAEIGIGSASIGRPCVESIRPVRRAGPGRTTSFGLVAELVQPVTLRRRGRGARITLWGGSTVHIGPDGMVRLVVGKRATRQLHVQRQLDFVDGQGQQFWLRRGDETIPAPGFFQRLCVRPESRLRDPRQPR